MVKVKVCGITNREDCRAAVDCGADAVGFVFTPSPRQVTWQQAARLREVVPSSVCAVGVFVNEDPDTVRELRQRCGLDAVQLHGDEDEGYALALGGKVIKNLAVGAKLDLPDDAYPGATLLLDTKVRGVRGGSGQTFDWSLARPLAAKRKIILAGGLSPDNVASAIQIVKPYAVDVSSGVEKSPGRKDHAKIAAFIARAKSGADRA